MKRQTNSSQMKDSSLAGITADKDRVSLEAADPATSLDAMLASFDAARHSGEVMAFAPIGEEQAPCNLRR